jgi:hypothetical protein
MHFLSEVTGPGYPWIMCLALLVAHCLGGLLHLLFLDVFNVFNNRTAQRNKRIQDCKNQTRRADCQRWTNQNVSATSIWDIYQNDELCPSVYLPQ